MPKAGSVIITPRPNTAILPKELIRQERQRQRALKRLALLRRKAFDEIERLLAFIDQSDPYVMTEQEINGDEDDASYPESGVKATRAMEDDEDDDPGEDDGTGEPSLGFLERSASVYGPVNGRDCSGDQSSNIRCQGLGADLEDEHDGGEPDEADYEPSAGFDVGEPSLGWTVDGCTTGTLDDLEAGEPARAPQNRAERLEQVVTSDTGVCSRRILGLSPSQREAMRERMDDRSGVVLVGGPEWGMP